MPDNDSFYLPDLLVDADAVAVADRKYLSEAAFKQTVVNLARYTGLAQLFGEYDFEDDHSTTTDCYLRITETAHGHDYLKKNDVLIIAESGGSNRLWCATCGADDTIAFNDDNLMEGDEDIDDYNTTVLRESLIMWRVGRTELTTWITKNQIFFDATNTYGVDDDDVPTTTTFGGASVTTVAGALNYLNSVNRAQDLHYYRRLGSTADRWYTSPITGTAMTATAVSADKLYAIPFICTQTTYINRIAINVTVLAGGGTAVLGIYEDDGNCYPGDLFCDCGTISTATTGVKSITDWQILEANKLYWLVQNHSATPTVRAFSVGSMLPILGFDNTLGTAPGLMWSANYTYDGTLPDPFEAGGTIDSSSAFAVFVRCVTSDEE